MKIKNNVLTYVLLSIALVVCLGGMTLLGYNIFFNKEVTMTNFEDKTKEDVLKWATKNNLENQITYEYVYSENIDKGKVVSQSLEANQKVTDNITISISKGSIIDININDYKTKKEFEDFITKYPNVKVTYEDDTNSNSDNELTKFSKNSIDIKGDSLTVYISAKDNEVKPENKDDKKDDAKDSGTKVLIPSNLLGMEEQKFIKTLNDLGFKNLKKSDKKYYSFTSKKDTIYSYDDGNIDTGKTINYALSLGDYPTAFDAKEYNNKTLDAAKTVAKKYDDLNAHVTLNTTDKETADTASIGKVNNCTCVKNGTKSIITCDLFVKKIETKEVPSYAGKTESQMQTALKALGFTKFNKSGEKYSSNAVGTVISNDTGNKKTNETINYVLSLGVYTPNMNEYNGKTLDQARSVATNYNNKGANVEIANPQAVENNTKPNNTLYDCSASNVSGKIVITCNLAKTVTRFDIPSEQFIKQDCSTSTYEGTVAKLKTLFEGKFTTVHYNSVESALGVGQIVNIKVGGNDNFTSGSYEASTIIEIDICGTQRN